MLRRNVDTLAVSDTEYEGRLGSWALLNGQKRTITPPVTPKDPEGNLLQNLVGTGLFFVPDDFPFYDVDSNDWFYEPVKSAWQNGPHRRRDGALLHAGQHADGRAGGQIGRGAAPEAERSAL